MLAEGVQRIGLLTEMLVLILTTTGSSWLRSKPTRLRGRAIRFA